MPNESFWVEVNGRVNYPIKKALVTTDNNLLMDMENQIDKFCVSWMAFKVASHGLKVYSILEPSSHNRLEECDMYAL